MGRVQSLRALDGGGRIRIEIGMILLGKQPVCGADLRERAIVVKAKHGVMIFFNRLQGSSLPCADCRVSFIELYSSPIQNWRAFQFPVSCLAFG